MQKRNSQWTEKKLAQNIKEGRGLGDGSDYLSWLNVQDFPSKGRASRVKGWTTNRVHHFFSDTQRCYFLCLDWEESVIDIKEHYPLFELTDCIGQVEDLNLRKFENQNGLQYMLTTTFLITKKTQNGSELLFARSVKYASELEKKITQEKLELERRYWSGKGINWGIITNKEINQIRVHNIEWINPVVSERCNIENKLELSEVLINRYLNSDKILFPILGGIDRDFCLEKGASMQLLKYLISIRKVALNMDEIINLRKPIELKIYP